MKRILLVVAVAATAFFAFSFCKNASMKCWEYTYHEDEYTGSGYVWCTQDQIEYNAYAAKKEGIVFTYKKASKYKTAEDCIDADDLLNKDYDY